MSRAPGGLVLCNTIHAFLLLVLPLRPLHRCRLLPLFLPPAFHPVVAYLPRCHARPVELRVNGTD